MDDHVGYTPGTGALHKRVKIGVDRDGVAYLFKIYIK